MKAAARTLAFFLCLAGSSALRNEAAAKDFVEEGVLGDDDDAKCNALVKGSHAVRFGSVLGGLKDCACIDPSHVMASKIGSKAYDIGQELTLDDKYNSFEYSKLEHYPVSYHCMTEDERLFRAAQLQLEKALDFKKTETTSWVFLGLDFLGDGLEAAGKAFKTPAAAVPALDQARTAAKEADTKWYQSEARACAAAVRGLEAAQSLLDAAQFGEAVGLLTEAATILNDQNDRDAAKDKAMATRKVVTSMVQALLPKVSEKVPAW
mmetsp:Transcript_52660/g.125821  ORF Transcript_52660/g.125821 Transcript_52660/m.125821 type:complete len:264 (-) Transcript_52660:85-876(-)